MFENVGNVKTFDDLGWAGNTREVMEDNQLWFMYTKMTKFP